MKPEQSPGDVRHPTVHQSERSAAARWPLALIWVLGLSPLLYLGVMVLASGLAYAEFGGLDALTPQLTPGQDVVIRLLLRIAAVVAGFAPLLIWFIARLRGEHGNRRGVVERSERHKTYLAWLLCTACATLLSMGMYPLNIVFTFFGFLFDFD